MIIDPEGTFIDKYLGSDANAGTMEKPVCTIDQAISIVETTRPGHPIYVFAKPEGQEYINGRGSDSIEKIKPV